MISVLDDPARLLSTATIPHRVVCGDSLARILLTAASRALRGRDCADIGDEPMLARYGGPGTPQQRHAATILTIGRGETVTLPTQPTPHV